MLTITDISKNFGDRRVIDAVSLKIGRGEAVSLLGSNGAGKTTLLRIAAGILVPDSGYAAIKKDGMPATSAEESAYRSFIGYVSSDENSFYLSLTAKENLDFFSSLGGRRKTPEDVLLKAEALGATEYLDTRFAFLSKGTKQKFSFLRAFTGTPEIILADELDALDAPSAAAAGDILKRFVGGGGALIVVGKYPPSFADERYILEKGKLEKIK